MAERPELVLQVPAEMTVRGNGLSMDMGGSVLKFVYRTKEDFEEASKEGSKFGRLRLVSFARTTLEQGLEYIRQRAYLPATDGDSKELTTIYSTGVGCTEHGKLISETLNVRLENLTEFDCFIKSFIYLAKRLPRHELLEPFQDEAAAEPIDVLTQQIKALMKLDHSKFTQALDVGGVSDSSVDQLKFCTGRSLMADQTVDEPLSQHEPDTFPCMVAMIGSGIGFMKVERDGTYKVVDSSNRGGKYFTGVGMLLTGAKTFEELVELAAKGDSRKLDIYSDELFEKTVKVEGEEDMYTFTQGMAPSLMYCFGKAATGKGNFSREDIAAAWLHGLALELVQTTQLVCIMHQVNRVFFCGSFPSVPIVRHILTREFARRNLLLVSYSQRTDFTYFDFVKPGPHLGALGAYVNAIEKVVG